MAGDALSKNARLLAVPFPATPFGLDAGSEAKAPMEALLGAEESGASRFRPSMGSSGAI